MGRCRRPFSLASPWDVLLDALADEGGTHAMLVPSQLVQLLEHDRFSLDGILDEPRVSQAARSPGLRVLISQRQSQRSARDSRDPDGTAGVRRADGGACGKSVFSGFDQNYKR